MIVPVVLKMLVVMNSRVYFSMIVRSLMRVFAESLNGLRLLTNKKLTSLWSCILSTALKGYYTPSTISIVNHSNKLVA